MINPIVLTVADYISSNDYIFKSITIYSNYILLIMPLIGIFCSKLFKRKYEILWIILCAILFIFIKIPTLFEVYLNPDEGMHLSVAQALYNGGGIFLSADATTLGPINQILLVLLPISGVGTLFSARLLALLLEIISFILIFKSIQKYSDIFSSYVLSVYFLLYTALFTTDIIAFNCETTLYFFASLYLYFSSKKISIVNKWLEFFTIGVLPFIKLQYLPIAAILFLISFIKVIKWNENNLSILKKFSTILGVVICFGILFMYSLINGSVEYFYKFYFVNAFAHVGSSFSFYLNNLQNLVNTFSSYIEFWPSVILLIVTSIEIIFLSSLIGIKFIKEKCLYILLLFTVVFCVTRPLQAFNHYLNIIVVFSIIVYSYVCRDIKKYERSFDYKLFLNRFNFFLFCIISVVLLGSSQMCDINLHYSVIMNSKYSSIWQIISDDIYLDSNENDKIVVWGWQNEIYDFARRQSATAQVNIERIVNNKYPMFNITKYVDDIKHNNPKFILDVVSPISFGFSSENFRIINYDFMNEIMSEYAVYKEYEVQGGKIIMYKRKNSD